MSGPSAWRRRSPVEAIQNTPENHADAVAFAVAHARSRWAHQPYARTGSVAGMISWWEGDIGTHCRPGDWLVADDGDLLVYDDAEFRKEFAPAGMLDVKEAFAQAMSYLEFWTSDDPAAVELVQAGTGRAVAAEFVAKVQAEFEIEPADFSGLQSDLEFVKLVAGLGGPSEAGS